MNMLEALNLCKAGQRVRPVCWQRINPDHWIESSGEFFVEHGSLEEIPHALRLCREDEFMGEWEVVK